MEGSKVLNIVVSGACSDIATEVMKEFALKNHSRFFLIARDLEKLKGVAQVLKQSGASEVFLYSTDLNHQTLENNLSDIITQAVEKLEIIDLLFIAQGVLKDSYQLEKNPEQSFNLIDINFCSVVSIIDGFKPYFIRQKQGRIAVISSVAADRARASNYLYGASKAAVSSYLDGLRSSLCSFNISVTCIKPGTIATKMTSHIKRSFLIAQVHRISLPIYKAIIKRKSTVYVPRIWFVIMFVVKMIPSFIMNRIKI